MEVFKEFTFDSAHFLPNVPDGHKCKNMHGHTYRVRIYCEGAVAPHSGWVLDFADIKVAWAPLNNILDHKMLNDIPGLENSTAENLAIWIWNRLKKNLPQLSKIMLWETPTSGVVYTG